MSSPGAFFRSQFLFHPPEPTVKYTGQTVMVTGSNVGLGLEAARWFVKLDAAKVILAVRSLSKGEDAKCSIESSEMRMGVVEVWSLDLASYDSVKAYARRAESLERLDVLVENACIVTSKWKMMEEDESTITTNVVSPLLHAILLLPKMRETSVKFNTTPKLVFVVSSMHWHTEFKERKEEKIFDALADEKKANMQNRYNLSKLLEMYSVRSLAALSTASNKPGNVIINCLNPGMVVSKAMREYEGITHILFKIFSAIVSRRTEVGSRTILNAAEAGQESHGQYLDDCKLGEPAPLISSEEGQQLQKRVWDELAEKLERIQPGILGNI
ncbi:MAG: hypothetical protein Q9163_004083 [Psora crenata]